VKKSDCDWINLEDKTLSYNGTIQKFSIQYKKRKGNTYMYAHLRINGKVENIYLRRYKI
jgi:hypothetical protein